MKNRSGDASYPRLRASIVELSPDKSAPPPHDAATGLISRTLNAPFYDGQQKVDVRRMDGKERKKTGMNLLIRRPDLSDNCPELGFPRAWCFAFRTIGF